MLITIMGMDEEKKETIKTKVPLEGILNEFSSILYKNDPAGTTSPHDDEYDAEALSILARFTEAALQLADDQEVLLHAAYQIVEQTLEFWFGGVPNNELLSNMTIELVNVYLSRFPASVTEEETKVNQTNVVISDDDDVPPGVEKLVIG